MKKIIYLIALLICFNLDAQNVGIGTKAPDASAVLDLESKEKGLLIPRLSLESRNNIKNPATGLLIYQTDNQASGFYFFNGKEWKPLSNASTIEMKSVATAGVDWATTGNTIAATDFIGSPAGTNLNPIIFKSNGIQVGNLNSAGSANTFLGAYSGVNNTGAENLGVGAYAMMNNKSGQWNVGVGSNALNKNEIGIGNTALGAYAVWQLFNGNYNVALGLNAQKGNALYTGNKNIAIGSSSMYNISTGTNENIAIGYQSLYNLNSGINNVSLGNYAMNGINLYSTEKNVALGFSAMMNIGMGANENVAIGNLSLQNNNSGKNNTAIGNNSGSGNISGSNNVFIGNYSGSQETKSNKLYISNNSTTTPLMYGDFSAKFISIGDVPVNKRDAIATAGTYGLLVKGKILTEGLRIALVSSNYWADYVFDDNYKLMSLESLEKYVKDNKHLPNIPSASEIEKDGIDMGLTSAKLLEKIEELTLYVIEQNKILKEQQKEINNLKSELHK